LRIRLDPVSLSSAAEVSPDADGVTGADGAELSSPLTLADGEEALNFGSILSSISVWIRLALRPVAAVSPNNSQRISSNGRGLSRK
jgi:hypothetical protein